MRSTGCGASISARPSPPPPRCRWCGLPPIRAVWSRSMRWRWWTEVSQDRNQMSLTHAQSRPHGEERRSASALRRVSKHAATAPADRRPSRRIAPCGAMLPRTRALLTASLLLCFMFSALQSLLAQGLPSPLSGIISSERDGVMEGVIVSARRAGSTITVSVVSDANGAYSFPAGRLDPGHYELRIRAAGYALDGSGTIELEPGRPATADLRLKPAARPASEITNAEWLASAPGDFEIKRLLLNCTDCHSLQRIFESRHSPAEFLKVFERMGGYYPGASDLQPQRLIGEHRRPAVPAGMEHKLADYLASINLFGRDEHSFDISTFPRPTGRATRVVITEYALPRREIQPHDVIVDPDGMVWYSHFGEQLLSRLDPRTGATTDFDPGAKTRLPEGDARSRARPGWQQLGRADVSDRDGQVRPQERIVSHLSDPGRLAEGRHPAIAFLGCRNQDRRQGVGEEYRRLAGLPARCRNRRLRKPRQLPRPREPADRHLWHLCRPREQCLHPRVSLRRHRQDRRQERKARLLSDADAVLPCPPRPRRPREPLVVRRVWKQWRRHARSGQRQDRRVEKAAALGIALRRRARSSWRGV